MSMNDGKITLTESLNQKNLSEVIQHLSYRIALDFIQYLNGEDYGQDEWDYTIEDSDGKMFTLNVKLNDWDINY